MPDAAPRAGLRAAAGSAQGASLIRLHSLPGRQLGMTLGSRDYERRLQSAEALIKLAMVRLMLRRLARYG